MKINRKYSSIVSGLLISTSLSLGISFFMGIINKVPGDEFVGTWLRSSLRGFSIGFPLSRIIVPIMLKVTEKITED